VNSTEHGFSFPVDEAKTGHYAGFARALRRCSVKLIGGCRSTLSVVIDSSVVVAALVDTDANGAWAEKFSSKTNYTHLRISG
jgi:hypothetical protein